MRFENLQGRKFGRLKVIEAAPPVVYSNGRSRTAWRCLCDCGRESIVVSFNLKNGGIISCGCAKAERNRIQFGTHNGSKERLYKVWTDMKKRCYNTKYKQYKDYGGRGIRVCDEWLNNYSAFRDFALSHGYDPEAKFGECTIDRIDVNGNYCPDNCRFVDMKTQIHNRRNAK